MQVREIFIQFWVHKSLTAEVYVTLCWLMQNQVKMFLLFSIHTEVTVDFPAWCGHWSVLCNGPCGLSIHGSEQMTLLFIWTWSGEYWGSADVISTQLWCDLIASRHGSGVNKGRWFGKGRRLAIGLDSQCHLMEKGIFFPKFKDLFLAFFAFIIAVVMREYRKRSGWDLERTTRRKDHCGTVPYSHDKIHFLDVMQHLKTSVLFPFFGPVMLECVYITLKRCLNPWKWEVEK